MPDLISHAIFASFLKPLFKKNTDLVMVLLGAVLPDIISRFGYILAPSSLYRYFSMLHTPAVLILEIAIITLLFQPQIRKTVFLSLAIGAATHFLLDFIQGHWDGLGTMLLFPFSVQPYEVGLFYHYQWPYLASILLIIMIIFILIKKFKKGDAA